MCVYVVGVSSFNGKIWYKLRRWKPLSWKKSFTWYSMVYSGVLMSPWWQWHHGLLFMDMQNVFSHISQMLLMSGVLIQLSLEKHMAQWKGFEIWRKLWKEDLPSLSLNVLSWRDVLYVILSRGEGVTAGLCCRPGSLSLSVMGISWLLSLFCESEICNLL